jgi:hypothetical protein
MTITVKYKDDNIKHSYEFFISIKNTQDVIYLNCSSNNLTSLPKKLNNN